MKTEKFKRLSILLSLCCILLNAQYSDAKIVMDTDRLRKSLNNELDNFEVSIQNYLLTTEFATDAMNIEFSIEIHFFLEEISDKAIALITASQPRQKFRLRPSDRLWQEFCRENFAPDERHGCLSILRKSTPVPPC